MTIQTYRHSGSSSKVLPSPADGDGSHCLDLLLLDSAIASMNRAMEAIEAGDSEACSNAVTLANAIVGQLFLSLDEHNHPPTARQLAQIYNFVLRRLPAVNIRDGVGCARQIRGILTPLRNAWSEALYPAMGPLAVRPASLFG